MLKHTPALEEVLRDRLPGYEPREGQSRMSEAVRKTLATNTQLIVEAGTGTGKSLAYLMPIAEHALAYDKRAVISTYTKTLQRQLVEKDLPFVVSNMFPDLRFTLCLGSENYLCLRRLELSKAQGLFDDNTTELTELLRWSGTTRDGVREGSGGPLWSKVSREADICMGKECRDVSRCFYQKARDEQRKSHILVVNHHLYFANLSANLRVLPEFGTAVFDEAHELEDVASDFLGTEISNIRLSMLLGAIIPPAGRTKGGLLRRLRWMSPEEVGSLRSIVDLARSRGDEFFSVLAAKLGQEQSLRIREPYFVEEHLSAHLLDLAHELDRVSRLAPEEELSLEARALSMRSEAMADALRLTLAQRMDNHVYWAERSGARLIRLVATPVDIAGMKVFGSLEAAIYTSATLTAGGSFKFVKDRLGLHTAEELILKSHFDYKRQATLYIARDLPGPVSHHYEDAAIARIDEILGRTRGRTLVLCTSYSFMRRAVAGVRTQGVEVLSQGSADSYSLIREFKANPASVLFGTYTFWQGIDVPGDALKCVVIARLPFAVPDEPVTQARMEALIAEGREPFMEFQVPQAAITLKQGFGRLIRTSTDTGTVAILDSRVLTKPYGKVLLATLPEAEVVYEIGAMRL